MSTIAVKQVKLGNDIDPSKNFVISTPSVADGTLTIKRQNGTSVLSIDAAGKAVIPGVVGTVAQVGGVPTGQVVERGSNANGVYVRFADGTQICNIAKMSGTISAGELAGSVAVGFPASFASSPSVVAMAYPTASNDQYGVTSVQSVSETAALLVIRNGATASQTFNTTTIAVGRWF